MKITILTVQNELSKSRLNRNKDPCVLVLNNDTDVKVL